MGKKGLSQQPGKGEGRGGIASGSDKCISYRALQGLPTIIMAGFDGRQEEAAPRAISGGRHHADERYTSQPVGSTTPAYSGGRMLMHRDQGHLAALLYYDLEVVTDQ
jgi:hypothetical protein